MKDIIEIKKHGWKIKLVSNQTLDNLKNNCDFVQILAHPKMWDRVGMERYSQYFKNKNIIGFIPKNKEFISINELW